jgi:MFS family permease
MQRNIVLYPWFKFVQQLLFWQANWFLYFEGHLSAAEAILLYVISDIAATVLEVPSGYMSDRLGRRLTLLVASVAGLAAAVLLVLGGGFAQFALANALLGAATAFASGTDSSLLFESLRAEGRETEIAAAELKASRFSFAAWALSALTGGAMALYDETLPFVATALAAAVALAITTLFREPPHSNPTNHRENLRAIGASLTQPTLLWLLCLTLLMYVFSHIPFVFVQPFLREALTAQGYAAETPLVAGTVTFLMMMTSLLVTLVAEPLHQRLGLRGILLLAFGMQIALVTALAFSDSLVLIALLLFRMVPNSISQPFMRARILPLLQDGTRATYLSTQSFAGRLLFAVTLSFAAGRTTADTPMPYADLQVILAVYAALGGIFLLGLASTARKAKI